MSEFSFRAFNADGKLETGSIKAASEGHASAELASRGLTAFDIALGNVARTPWWSREVSFGRPGVSAPLAGFLRAFAFLLDARLPLPDALRLATADVRHKILAEQLSRVHAELQEGTRLGDAIERRAPLIPDEISAMLRIGEATNRLDVVSARVADLAERDIALRTDLRGALTYPAILLAASLIVIAMLIFLIVPTLAPVFAAVGAQPPWSIGALLAVRQAALDWWPIILPLAFMLVLGTVVLWRRAGSGELIYRLPVLGSILAGAESSRVLGSLGLMLEAHLNLPDALRLSAETARRPALGTALSRSAEDVEAGRPLISALESETTLPPVAHQMLRVGVEGNRLPEMLAHVARVLETKTRERIKRALGLVTPVLTLVIGLIIGALIYSTLTAILDINDLAFG